MAKEDDNGKLHSEQNGRFVSKGDAEEKRAEAEQIYNDVSENDKPASYSRMQADEDNSEDEGAIDGELSELLGDEFKGVKGQEAIDKLLKEKRGHVKAAFHREDIGDIDLLWGNDSLGLQHIIRQREKEKKGHANEILSDLSIAIEQGTFRKRNNRGNFEFKHGKSYVIIAPEYHGNKITYLLTAYKRN